MLTCEKCKISLTGVPEHCPLCQGDLAGAPEPGEERFPEVPPERHPHARLIRLILFGTVVAAAVCLTVNLSLPAGGWWSLFVLAGIASLWLTFAVVVRKRGNIPKNILWQVAVVSLLAVLWDKFTGWHGWSVDYVVPILCACAMAAMGVIARIMRLRIEDYIIYLVLDCVLGVIPLVLLLAGALRVVYPSAICVGASIVSLGALFVFEGEALRDELYRRMHL